MVFDTGFNTPPLELVYHAHGLKCIDGRDKIYALLSIASDGSMVKPHYSLSTIQVSGCAFDEKAPDEVPCLL